MDSKEIKSLKFKIDFLKTEISVLKEYSDDDIIEHIKNKIEKDKNERNYNDPNNLHFGNYSNIKEELAFKKIEYKKRIFEAEAELKQLKKRKNRFKNESTLKGSIFNNSTSIEKFENYIKLHIVEPYVDYSYLYQRMLKENIISNTKHKDFANWLYDNKHINERVKDSIIEQNGFRSLNKSSSIQRENNFNNIFNI